MVVVVVDDDDDDDDVKNGQLCLYCAMPCFIVFTSVGVLEAMSLACASRTVGPYGMSLALAWS